jgi:Na+-driven multidrug efflux pump
VIATGVEYLQIISYNYVASGLIFVSASMFQAMGNTLPSLAASFLRIMIVAIPAVIMSRMPGFTLTWIWYLSVFAVWIQLLTSLYLLRRELGRKLGFPPEGAVPAAA